MKNIFQFDVRYDVERLQADLARVQEWHDIYVPDYFEGSWTAVALISNEGKDTPESLERADAEGVYSGTALLDRCPYFQEIIESLGCRTERVRLMRLAPGSVVKEHRDIAGGRPSGMVRLHLPVQTNPDVHFIVDGERIPMCEGELWYTNIMLPHAVRNESVTDRVHLVLDLVVDGNVRRLFPRETLKDRLDRFQYAHRAEVKRFRRYPGIRFLDRALGFRRRRKRRKRAASNGHLRADSSDR